MEKYKLLITTFFRKKKLTKFCLILFIVIITSFSFLLGINNNLSKRFNNIKRNNIDHNYIKLEFSEPIKNEPLEINKIKHVKNTYYLIIVENNNNIYTYIDSNLYDIKKGRKIENQNEIIIPESLEQNDTEITFDLLNNDEKLKIVGTYSSSKYMFGINKKSIITSYEFINNIAKDEYKYQLIIEVEDYSYVDHVKKEIDNKYDCDITIYDANINVLNKHQFFENIITILKNIFLVVYFIIILTIEIIILYDEKKDNFILRSLGFPNLKIMFSLLLKLLLTMLVSFIISIPIILILSLLFRSFLLFDVFFQFFMIFLILISISFFFILIIIKFKKI